MAKSKAEAAASKKNPSLPFHVFSDRGKEVAVKVHPPSIPTRFQTIHYDDNESKGFNSTAPRFSSQKVRFGTGSNNNEFSSE